MAGKKGGGGGGEGSKKAQGQARKADAAAQKAADEDSRREARDAAEWDKGAKNNSKKEAEAAKKAEQARKKAEKDALMAEDERNTPGRSAPKSSKAAPKKAASRGLDLSQLDDDGGSSAKGGLSALNASGIDNALDALSLAGGSSDAAKVDRHPERRFKAAFAAFEERRLKEAEADGSMAGLRLKQKQERLRKEFERSPENPFNQVTASYDASKGEVKDIRESEKDKIETRLAEKE
ncbi:hypothetical protein RB594_000350 [Gaeumannomyces avenae]